MTSDIDWTDPDVGCSYCGDDIQPGQAYRQHLNTHNPIHEDCLQSHWKTTKAKNQGAHHYGQVDWREG